MLPILAKAISKYSKDYRFNKIDNSAEEERLVALLQHYFLMAIAGVHYATLTQDEAVECIPFL